MNVLVTGATGFVGGHLVDQLLQRGDRVTALVRSPERARAMAERGVRLVVGDLDNRQAIAEAMAEQDVIYHSAALTGAVDEAEFMRANRDGTANLVEAAVQHTSPPRFVLVSSMAAGGPSHHATPRNGTGDDRPVTMYGRSKLAGELALREAGLPWSIIRPPTVYGPRDRDNLLAIYKAARFGIAPVFGSGTMELSVVHVEDLASAIIHAGNSPAVLQAIWYVNHPEILTSAQLVRIIGRQMGKEVTLIPLPEWVTRPVLTATELWAGLWRQKTILRADKANEFYQDAWTGDPLPFISATGWTPQYDFASGSAQTAAWYREQGWL